MIEKMSGNGRRVGVALCLVALVTGCTVGPSQRPPVAVRGENVPVAPMEPAPFPTSDALPPLQPQNASISFTDCTVDALALLGLPAPTDRDLTVECGELPVPVDPARPDLGSVLLGVVRAGTGGVPSEKPPLLALGDSVAEPTVAHAVELATRVSPALLEEFTMIGLDRRGSGVDRLACAPPEARAALIDADPAATAEADLAALLEQARSIVQDCNLDLPSALSGFGAAATAVDIELLRSRLGVATLSAIGVGDGAAALAAWAGSAPGGVGRLVLDGPGDPLAGEADEAAARAAGTEAAFDAFALACTGQGACPLGADPRATVTGLLDRLRTQPLATPDGRRLTAGAATRALLFGLSEPADWPALHAALAAAVGGDAVPLLAALDPLLGPLGRFDGALAVACNDAAARLSPLEVGELAARMRAEHPLAGGALALDLLACAPWPTGASTTPARPAGGLPPVLVIGTAADPRAGLEGSRRTAGSLPSGLFLGWQGAGTGAYPRTPCVTEVVEGMLVNGQVPTSGTLCPP